MSQRILVVDDEEAIRDIVCSMLVSANYQCQEASSGNKALAVLNSGQQFDLILTGLMMADLDGIGLLEAIKVQYPTLPVVLMTGVHDRSVALAAIRHGASDYLLKPFERRQLFTVIDRALEGPLDIDGSTEKTTLEALVTARTQDLRAKFPTPEETLREVFRLRDEPHENRHNRTEAAYAVAIAHAMGLSREQLQLISRGAFLHDIGQVPALRDILLQADSLQPDELAVLCQLSNDIHEMLKAIPTLEEAAEIVHSYAECFDGTGHPHRLKGDEIPLGARILSVALTMAECIEPRYRYSGPQTVASAYAEVQRWSGQRFDPDVVRTVLSMPDNTWTELLHGS